MKLNLQRTDDLRRRILNFLAGRNLPGLRHVDVEVTEGVVMLSGRVRSFYEKQLANHCCRRVAGVHEVVDSIDVATYDWPVSHKA
jgi:osmotically-inducible protein OsmY